MKTLMNYFLSFALIVSTSSVQAGDTRNGRDLPAVSEATASFEQVFKSAVYSVRTIPDIIKDLDDMDRGAGSGISKNMAVEIYSRLDAAMKLISLIMVDVKLTERQRHEMVSEMSSAVGEVIFTVLRQHGEDKVEMMIRKRQGSGIADLKTVPDFLLGMFNGVLRNIDTMNFQIWNYFREII